jgi:23S rRNA pseudouridine1911/1915/1917 synthase
MTRFKLEWIVNSKDAGKTIKEFLKEKNISKASLTDIKFNGGLITVNNQEQNVRFRLQKDDHLIVHFPKEEPSLGLLGEDIPLSVLYEDDFLLVVNKPSEMNTIPSKEHPTGSLSNALIGYYEKIGLKSTVHVVTRLDRNTTGLVLIAKNRYIHHLFSQQQKKALIKRQYEAFVEGTMKENGVIEAPIGRKSTSIIEREVRSDGQYALTHYRVIRYYPEFTWLELQLETGRTHQIRVHMSYIGHPLLGDGLYGGNQHKMSRQALHCKRITFYHPVLKEELEFTAEMSKDMKELIE